MTEIKECSMYSDLKKILQKYPKRPALYFMGNIITAKQLLSAIDKWAQILKYEYGIESGDAVAMNLPNIPNAIILYYAINKCGATANLFHPYLPPKTVFENMLQTNCKLFITLDSYYEKADDIFKGFPVIVSCVSDYLPSIKGLIYRRKEKISNKNLLYKTIGAKSKAYPAFDGIYNNTAVYMHSSGTSAQPKTVILSNSSVLALSDALSYVIPNMNPTHNKCIMVLPLFHGFGFGVCMHAMLAHGFEVILIPKFKPKYTADVIKKRKATICAGVPLMFEKLFALPHKDFKKLKFLENIFVGGDKLSVPLKEKFDKRLKIIGSEAELTEGYGLTETVTVCCVNEKGQHLPTAMGKPLKCANIVITDDKYNILSPMENGEICITGTTLMEGYFGDETNSAFIYINDNKYVKTGDIGFLDEQGCLHFLDRKKRMFKLNGIGIFPSEIERLVKNNCDVDDCAVSFVNNKIYLYISTGILEKAELKNQILSMLKSNLLPYAVPKNDNIIFVNKFPKTIVGKNDIKELDRIYAE